LVAHDLRPARATRDTRALATPQPRWREARMARRSALGVLAASMFAGAAVAHAGPIQFGVVGSAIDLSANVSEAILPGGTVFQDSRPLLGTEPDPNQSAELLHLSDKGLNGSGRST